MDGLDRPLASRRSRRRPGGPARRRSHGPRRRWSRLIGVPALPSESSSFSAVKRRSEPATGVPSKKAASALTVTLLPVRTARFGTVERQLPGRLRDGADEERPAGDLGVADPRGDLVLPGGQVGERQVREVGARGIRVERLARDRGLRGEGAIGACRQRHADRPGHRAALPVAHHAPDVDRVRGAVLPSVEGQQVPPGIVALPAQSRQQSPPSRGRNISRPPDRTTATAVTPSSESARSAPGVRATSRPSPSVVPNALAGHRHPCPGERLVRPEVVDPHQAAGGGDGRVRRHVRDLEDGLPGDPGVGHGHDVPAGAQARREPEPASPAVLDLVDAHRALQDLGQRRGLARASCCCGPSSRERPPLDARPRRRP